MTLNLINTCYNLIPSKMSLFLIVLLKSKKMTCTKTISHIPLYGWNT